VRQHQEGSVPSQHDQLSADPRRADTSGDAVADAGRQSLRVSPNGGLRPARSSAAPLTFQARVATLQTEGFTERQAAFLVTVMLHAGVCMVRQYCTFAGIAHGHNAREFFARLVERRIATPYAALHARARLYHIHHRRLYAAIGEPHSRFRKPLPAGRAMERLMMLDAVLDQPAIAWLATEGDKWTHFIRGFGTALTIEWLPQLRFGTPPHVTVRYFPDRQPIGIVEPGETYTFLYLATKPSTVDLHAFLQRHAELLRTVPKWTVRVLLPPHLFKARESYVRALRLELGTRLAPHMADEFRWWCRARKSGAHTRLAGDSDRWFRASRAFASPRFRALYQSWSMLGDYVIDSAISPILADAMERGTGRIECEVLTRPYLHLSTLVGTA
jgi:hypothetical protein